jgi:lambda family phage tail tape measure protein
MATNNEQFIAEFSVRGLQDLDKAKDKISAINDKVNLLATSILGVSFGQFIHGALQSADQISDFSDATNISIASLKAFGAALDDAGGKAKNTEKIINSFYAAIDSANQGSLAVRDAFKSVGVSLQDLGNLSETELLNKTLKALKEMPPGAERASVATTLLSKAFRGVDPKAFEEALDPAKFLASEEATKRAAAKITEMDAKFRTLQEGALLALDPILKLMGETELSASSATKIIQVLGAGILLAFGASVAANILTVVKAVKEFNVVSKAGLAIDIAKQALQGPKGWAVLAGAAVATGAAIYGLNKLLSDTGDTASDTAKEIANATGGGKGLSQATPTPGNAGRKQELDTRQRAAIESNKRIAQANADIDKETALRTASDIEKIEIERDANIAKMKIDVNAKTDLSTVQKAREITAQEKLFRTKAETDIAAVKLDQEKTVYDQKKGYADQNLQLLGLEKTEVQKVTDTIAEQPLKYKEIGDQLLRNAAAQDKNIKLLRDFKSALDDSAIIGRTLFDYAYNETQALNKKFELSKAGNETERRLIESKYALQQKAIELEKSLSSYKEYELSVNGLSTKSVEEQLSIRERHVASVKKIKEELEKIIPITEENIRRDQEYVDSWTYGWEEAFKKYAESANNAASQATTYFGDFTRGVEDAFISFAKTGKLSFQNLIDSMIADVIRFQIRSAISNQSFGGLFGSLGALFGLGKGTGGGSIVGAPVSSSILPGAVFGAAGGSLMADRPRMVGESGPELFIPASNGTLIPNNQLGGGGTTNINYNIQAVDASSFRTLVARDPQFIYAVTEQGRRSQPSRRLS